MLPLNFDPVLAAFASPLALAVSDSTGAYVHGQWLESEPVARPVPLSAIVLAMPPARLQLYKEGDSAVAGIALHTKEVLYFTDVGATDREQRQSYVEYQGYCFRVVGSALFLGNANCHLYEALRYFS